MITLLVVFSFVCFCAAATWVYWLDIWPQRQRSEASIRTDLLAADQAVAEQHRRARHAMNEAAGQSWRNLAG